MSNSQILDDLRYCAEAFTGEAKVKAEANALQFAAGLIGSQISLPAQKPVSVPGGSGAGLVGIPVHRSALMSGNGAGFVDSACAIVLAHDDTSPDSLIPSRMAAFSTMYASQHVTINEIKPIAAENKKARPSASVSVTSISSPVVVRPIIHVRKSNLDLIGSKLVVGPLV